MRVRMPAVGCALVGAVLLAGAPALAHHTPQPAPDGPRALEPAPVTIRQTLTVGNQNTWVAGVKLTRNGAANAASTKKLRSRLGGWTCDDGWAQRTARFNLHLHTRAAQFTCNANSGAVTMFAATSHHSRLITEHGTVRVGQTWRSVPAGIRKAVHRTARAKRSDGGSTSYWIGRHQDLCKPTRALPARAQTKGAPSPAAVTVSRTGRVQAVAVVMRHTPAAC